MVMQINNITLYSCALEETKHFYERVFGFSLIEASGPVIHLQSKPEKVNWNSGAPILNLIRIIISRLTFRTIVLMR